MVSTANLHHYTEGGMEGVMKKLEDQGASDLAVDPIKRSHLKEASMVRWCRSTSG